MAKHEFGIMQNDPTDKERFDSYISILLSQNKEEYISLIGLANQAAKTENI